MKTIFIFILTYFVVSNNQAQTAFSKGKIKIPQSSEKNNNKKLIINEKPFIMLAGEIHNSSSSNLQYMEKVWDKLVALNCNTALVPVSWELVEPTEGKFDFDLVEQLILKAREHKLKLVFLWFGTWKNAFSTYAPEWVKTDLKRFPRAEFTPGDKRGIISCFSKDAMEADKKTFSALMAFIKKIDELDQTVIMVQVENEVGIHSNRDFSELAGSMFSKDVPSQLTRYLFENKDNLTSELKLILEKKNYPTTGTWTDVFGDLAEEVFMCWYTGYYVNEVAKAGKSQYPLPMYVNAWVEKDNGGYPKGGPVGKMLNIWKAAAPDIDMFCPDIYGDDFKKMCDQYTKLKNPLFIPEIGDHNKLTAYLYYALGKHAAIGFSPFGIDDFPDTCSISYAYKSLKGFVPELIKYQGTNSITGFYYTSQKTDTIEMANYKFAIDYNNDKKDIGGGLVINTGKDEFIFTGLNCHVSFLSYGKNTNIEFISIDEVTYTEGKEIRGRRLNGDEMNIQFNYLPGILKVKVFAVP